MIMQLLDNNYVFKKKWLKALATDIGKGVAKGKNAINSILPVQVREANKCGTP
jgi:hypothetical protein